MNEKVVDSEVSKSKRGKAEEKMVFLEKMNLGDFPMCLYNISRA